MPDQEILTKLEGLVFHNCRIGKLVGEGKEKVVLHALKLDDKQEVVIKLYQSNPMFLLNELDFEFAPQSAEQTDLQERHLNILEKLLTACERECPGLFFWHMESLYSRILVGLCEDFDRYNKPVLDTTTLLFQNEELVVVGTKALNRKLGGNFMDMDWEFNLKDQTLRKVIDFVGSGRMGTPINFKNPTTLLALVFCEGFFGTIPSKSEGVERRGSFFGELTDDSPPAVDAEGILTQFLDSTDFKETVSSMRDGVATLKKALEQLRGMLLVDAFDEAEQLRNMGEPFVMRYNAGRNTLLRGLPRCIRVMEGHLR